MTRHLSRWHFGLVILPFLAATSPGAAAEKLSGQATQIFQKYCHRCHGQDGAVEGGFNYVLDVGKLKTRGKVVPGQPDRSPLFQRVVKGKMPPPDEKLRPGQAEVKLLRQWIEAGAPSPQAAARPFLTESDIHSHILADLDKMERRARRFARYFTLTHLANAGLGNDELQTYRSALAKLLNSLSWHPRVSKPVPIDPHGTVLRIDLRDFMWDANLWNRLVAEYPYGVIPETTLGRAITVATATRLPWVRADWFVATASRAPLYYELLQIPAQVAELERQLRVDVAVNLLQDRVARAGFNNSGISRNNRLLERHDAVHGAYWKTYDFEAVPQNLVDRPNLLPDRRNLFAYPLGPGFTDNTFQHAGGEVIFNLPNGLQGYMLVNVIGQRLDKAPTAIVSDPRRPDRAVEAGLSCIGCHLPGIHAKTDQVRAFVEKNPKAFSRPDAERIRALYVPEKRMTALMNEDAQRYQKALEKTGSPLRSTEPVITLTLRYEAEVDLPAAASEVGMKPNDFRARLGQSDGLGRNLGALQVPGGTVQRQVFIQAFADLVRELRLGTLLQAGATGASLPDNTGEIDPLEGQAGQANAVAFSPDRRFALFASADRSVRLWDVEVGRELRRFIGHSASVWCVAFSPDGRRALSGSADQTVRLWDVASGRELRRLDGHEGVVTAVAFSPDETRALSGGFDAQVFLWDLPSGREIRAFRGAVNYVTGVAFAPDGRQILACGDRAVARWGVPAGQKLPRLEGHTDYATCVAVAPDGKRALSGSDDGGVRLWDLAGGKLLRTLTGHTGPVKSVAVSPDGKRALSGGTDRTVRLWDLKKGKELGRFDGHGNSVVQVAFTADGKYAFSGDHGSVIRLWQLSPLPAAAQK